MSALVFSRNLAWLRGAWANREITPVICRETAEELMRVLNYTKFKLGQTKQEDLLGDYLPYAESAKLPHPLPPLPSPCRDLDDEVFLHLALTAKADFLATGDADLLALLGTLPVSIITVPQLRGMLA